MSKINRRKKYFVDQSVQGKILLQFIWQWAIFLLTTFLFLCFIDMVTGAARELWKDLPAKYGPTLLAVVVLAPIFIRDLSKATNRFAGPILRLSRSMKDLADGRPVQPIKFRNGDEWHHLAESFNQIADRVQRLEEANRKLEQNASAETHSA